jgi:probable FeS assembly SUF system protein SufT
MHENTEFTLSRDTEAIQIPSGQKDHHPCRHSGVITQTLGGSYTIATYQGLARIAEKDLDALGIEKPHQTPNPATANPNNMNGGGEVDEKAVWDQLRQCYDPEIPLTSLTSALSTIACFRRGRTAGRKVDVKMTLTAPGCGMGPAIAHDAQSKIMSIEGVDEAQVDLVWDPPWNQNMISEAGRMKLGMV